MLRFKKYDPDRKLSDYVESYFTIELDDRKDFFSNDQNKKEYLFNNPQGTIDLMFGIRGGIDLANFKGKHFDLSRIFLMAQQEGYFKINFLPGSFIVGTVFYSESFHKLFNLPLAELTNTGRNIEEELSEPYLNILDRLVEEKDPISIIHRLNRFWINELAKVDFSFTKFDLLIRQLREGDEIGNIKHLAGQANMSERSLQRKMKKFTGVTPKSYSKVIRFKRVLELINSSQKIDWQDVLYQCGYFDQAHFIKDFKLYTGSSPTEFLKQQENLSRHFLG